MIVTELPKTVIPLFMCPECGAAYTTQAEAEGCPVPLDQTFKPGDWIIVAEGYTWHDDGREAWVAGHETGWHGRRSKLFWYMVTDVTSYVEASGRARVLNSNPEESHETVLHIATYGANAAPGKPRINWTPISGHRDIRKPGRKKPPPEIVAELQGAIGRRGKQLL